MKFQGEPFFDESTKRWYIVLQRVLMSGKSEEIRKSPPVFFSKEEAEREIESSIREMKINSQ